jgi:AcrR family transcriptional regulator
MNEEKLPRREKDKLRHRAQMLAAALALFSEKGYHNVSMHEIAQRAEFAIGTLYKFFKNKEELYKSLMMEKAEELFSLLREVLSKNDHIINIIRTYIAAKAGFFTGNNALLRLYFAETQGASFNIKAGLDQDIRKLHDKLIEQLTSVLEKGIRANVLCEVNPYYLSVALEGLTNAFLFCWLDDSERHPCDANVTLIADLFLKGCLPHE